MAPMHSYLASHNSIKLIKNNSVSALRSQFNEDVDGNYIHQVAGRAEHKIFIGVRDFFTEKLELSLMKIYVKNKFFWGWGGGSEII